MGKLLTVGGIIAASALLLCPHASAAETERGLLITPVRQFLSVDAGKVLDSSFVVADLTDKPLAVDLSVKQFTVTDYTYDYQFNRPENDWLHLGDKSVNLQPGESKTVSYSVEVPAGTAPGGQYYTLFASAVATSDAGVKNTIQAANLIYLTVNGKLSQVSHLQSSSIPWIVFGRSVPYKLEPVNTGNIYSYVYVSGELHGLFVKPPQTSSGHILIPGRVRTLTSSIATPPLPGIYKATYGYKTEGNWVIQESRWILFIPPWFIAFSLATLLIATSIIRRKKHERQHSEHEKSQIS